VKRISRIGDFVERDELARIAYVERVGSLPR
ncbi:hypothetical protein A2U01_0073186, partial [Trifolium medium]|nr:hypothetical protein [Trifolium medium]